jgi:hypothetical protein
MSVLFRRAPALVWSWTATSPVGDYGTVAADSNTPTTFTLTNTGGSASAAVTVTVTGSAFSLQKDTCTGASLGPHKSCTVQVTYAGGSGETDHGSLAAIAKKAAPTASATVQLTGTVAKATPTLQTSPSAPGTVGQVVLNDTATLTGGASPGGPVTFYLYNPTDGDCSGTPAYAQTVVTPTDGKYTTTNTAAAGAAGTWSWTVTYSGDAHNNGASSECQEAVAVNQAVPSISESPNSGGIVVGAAATLKDSATLTGGYEPTGSITFYLYDQATQAEYDTENVPVKGDGTYATPNGVTLTPAVQGTYQWEAYYSGDTNNEAVYDASGFVFVH